MSVSQRKDGRWLVKYKDPLGVWKQKAFRQESDARRFDDEQKYDTAKESRLTLREAVVAYVRSRDLSVQRRQIYSFLVNGYDRKDGTHTEGPAEFLADKYCTELDRRDLENFKMRLLERGNKGVSVNMHIGCLKAVLAWSESEDLIPFDPWRKYRVRVKDKVRHKSGSYKDFQAVYALLPGWMQWACRTCMALCLRPGKELEDLEWSAFNWEVRCVTVYMSKVDREKTVFPPESYLTEAWKKYQADTEAGRPHVCHGKRTEQLSYKSFSTIWKIVRAKVGVKVPPYVMRHLVASTMLAQTGDLPAVSRQLGHANPGITASIYANVVAATQQRNVATKNPLVQLGAGSKKEKQKS